jgi:ankyrin repeat protein
MMANRLFRTQKKGKQARKGNDILPSETLKSAGKRQVRPMNELFVAAIDGDNAKIRRLIKAGADIAAKDCAGATAMHYAATKGHTKTCRLLMREYSRLGGNVKDLLHMKKDDGATPLHDAIAYRHIETAYILITAEQQ